MTPQEREAKAIIERYSYSFFLSSFFKISEGLAAITMGLEVALSKMKKTDKLYRELAILREIHGLPDDALLAIAGWSKKSSAKERAHKRKKKLLLSKLRK